MWIYDEIRFPNKIRKENWDDTAEWAKKWKRNEFELQMEKSSSHRRMKDENLIYIADCAQMAHEVK